MPPCASGSNLSQLLATDCGVNETTHGFAVSDHVGELSSELLHILHTVGIVTSTVEGNGHFTVLHVRDVLDGAGLKVKHDKKKSKGLSEVF